jgi:hypothetical protein
MAADVKDTTTPHQKAQWGVDVRPEPHPILPKRLVDQPRARLIPGPDESPQSEISLSSRLASFPLIIGLAVSTHKRRVM